MSSIIDHINFSGKFITKAIVSIIFIALILMLASGILYATGQLSDILNFHFLNFTFSLALFFFYCGIIIYLVRSGRIFRLREKKFLLLVLLFAFIVSLVSVILADYKTFGDYSMYYQNAVKIVKGDLSGSYIWKHLNSPYIKRPLVNLVPVFSVFGTSAFVVKAFNILIHLFTGILIYGLVKQVFNRAIFARLALILFFCLPLHYITLNIPSHDVPGLFFIVLCFYLIALTEKHIRFKKKTIWLFSLSIFTGIVIFILDLSRSAGVFIYYSLIVVLLFELASNFKLFFKRSSVRQQFFRIFIKFVIPIAVYFLLIKAMPTGQVEVARFTNMFASTETSAEKSGGYSDIADNKAYFKLINKTEKKEMALGKYRSELYYNFQDYVNLFIRKINQLYRFGGDFSWARTYEGSKIINWTGSFLQGFIKFFRILLFFLCIIGLIHVLKSKFRSSTLLVFIVYWFIISLALSLIGEVNPVYSYLLTANFVIFASVGFVKLPNLIKSLDFSKKQKIQFHSMWMIRAGLGLLLLIGLFLIVSVFMKKSLLNSGLIYRDLKSPELFVDSVFMTQSKKENMVVLPMQEQAMKYGLMLPAKSKKISASWEFKVKHGSEYVVRGFIREKKGRDKMIKTKLFINDQPINSGSGHISGKKSLKINSDFQVRYFSYKPLINETGEIQLQMVLEAPENFIVDKSVSELSASFLEFLQIVEVEEN